MEKIILYGIGKRYKDYKEYIERKYEIIGYCDINESKIDAQKKYINISRLTAELSNVDYVLITPAGGKAIEIKESLINMGVPPEKIRLLSTEKAYKNCWYDGEERKISPHAENYEDLVIDIIRGHLGIKYSEFSYVDVGVNDPIINNNTYYFYERGSRGILVEANPEVIPTIELARNEDIILNRALYEGDVENVDFYISNASQLSSIYAEHIEERFDYRIKKKVSIPTISINDLLKKAEENGMSCKYLSLDIEGYDHLAIKNIDFNCYRPVIIMVEMILNRAEGNDIIKHMKDMDYQLVFNNECNGIFVDKKYIDKIG